MARIICGIFDTTVNADAALEELKREGFQRSEVDAFYVSPPGQHAMMPLGGDSPHASEGSRTAGIGAGLGAAIGALVGGGAGWIAASAMSRVRGGKRSTASREHPVEPRGGRMIAVNVDRPGTEKRAIEILRRHRARDVRRAEGKWANGSWRDFDPRAPLATV
jgi:hypothetical protein